MDREYLNSYKVRYAEDYGKIIIITKYKEIFDNAVRYFKKLNKEFLTEHKDQKYILIEK